MTPVLRASHVHQSYGGHVVLRDVGIAVDPGHRTGLVGENGAGKSTLLRILAGTTRPDDGDVSRPADLGFLHQEFPYAPSVLMRDVVADALAGVRSIEAEVEAAAGALAGDDPGAPGAYDRALARAQTADVWDADARAARTLAGLGLDADALGARPVGTLSGGQRTRLGLAALLIRQPGALILDEPTNHLDDAAAEYLAGALRALPGAVVLASHDRVFLDEVCTEILDLDPVVERHRGGAVTPAVSGAGDDLGTGATLYGGTYTDYLEAKRIERERWERRFAAEQEELRELRRSVATTARQVAHDRPQRDNAKTVYDFKTGRVQSQVSRRVRNAQQRLDVLDREQVRRPPPPLRFAPPRGAGQTGSLTSSAGSGPTGSLAPPPPPGSGPTGADGGLTLWARDVVVRGRLDLRASGVPSLDIARNTKLLVTGANGSGKSTLLHVLAGDLAPDAGSVGRARGVRVALLEQDVHLHDDARTARGLLALVQVGADGQEREAPVEAHGLVAPRDLDRPLADLSVGQRRRVVLAMLITQAPDVLLLDEPTNHVSLTLATELMAAVGTWPGAVVVASHDRWLRRNWRGGVVHLG